MDEPLRRGEVAGLLAPWIAAGALLPRRNWVGRLRPRGLLLYVGGITLVQFAARQWLVPWSRRLQAEHDRLAERLGRQPTQEELVAGLRRSR
jgi:hypothetical protein